MKKALPDSSKESNPSAAFHPIKDGENRDNWAVRWFGSPYYALLYNQRGEGEAGVTIHNMVRRLGISAGSKVLDLACGRGRHTRQLYAAGMESYGYDISETAIAEARQLSAPGIHFRVHDMRKPFPDGNFHAIVNLFTSFGYFDALQDHVTSVQHIARALAPGGFFVLDYLNRAYVLPGLVAEERLWRGKVRFDIQRYVEGTVLVKRIRIQDGAASAQYEERVQTFGLEDFRVLFKQQGLTITQCYGGYAGEEFVEDLSPRLIIFFRKV